MSDPHVMRAIVMHYYSNLLSLKTFFTKDLTFRSHVWNMLEQKITSYMNAQLQEVFSYDKMSEAHQALLKHRCPCMDGLTPTFFLIGTCSREIYVQPSNEFFLVMVVCLNI